MSVTRTIEISDITPAELAKLFTDMDDRQQAAFFAEIKPITDKWDGAGWCQQCCSIAGRVNSDAREVIAKLAEHVLGYDEIVDALKEVRRVGDDKLAFASEWAAAVAKADAAIALATNPQAGEG